VAVERDGRQVAVFLPYDAIVDNTIVVEGM
jgi:hypothetical protein